MYYVNQIKALLNCDTENATAVYNNIAWLDLSEITQGEFNREVRIANMIVNSSEEELVAMLEAEVT